MNVQASKLRELLTRPEPVVSMGVWDPYSAIVAEQEGFEVLTVFGSIVSWAMLGTTDSGYITQTEIADTARRIIQSVSVPVIVDCDDGFGDPINVRRTVQIMEHMGAAGMYIEDLSRPLRCSAMGDGGLISSDVMIQKIRAAVEARTDPDFFIMARTDNYEGVDEMIARCRKYVEAGADMALVIGLTTEESMERVAAEAGVPLSTLQPARTKMPFLPHDRVKEMGYRIVFHVQTMYMAAAQAMRDAARDLKEDVTKGTEVPRVAPGPGPIEIEKTLGLDLDTELNNRYSGTSVR